MEGRPKVLIVCGPTASGKTSLAISLGQKFNGEIISADSMQIYKNLNVGTAKPTKAECAKVPHHLIDFLNPSERFSVADYISLADEKINALSKKNNTPIICGGTGQYISGLVSGLSFVGAKSDDTIREELWQREKEQGIDALYAQLCEIDLQYAKTLHINNKGRIIRALELYLQTGKTMTQQLRESIPPQKPYNELVIGINFPERATLYDKINNRVDAMLENGLLQEARLVYDNKESYITAAQAIGYKEFFPLFENTAELCECVESLKKATRNYAKRQLTWFKKIEGIIWLNAESKTLAQEAAELWEKHNEGKGQN